MSNLETIRQSMISILTQGNASNIDWNSVRVLAEEAEAEESRQFEAISDARPFYHRCVKGGAFFLLIPELTVDVDVTEENILQWVVTADGQSESSYHAFGFNNSADFRSFLQGVATHARSIAYITNQVAAGNTMWLL
jgi:hypothetical protein